MSVTLHYIHTYNVVERETKRSTNAMSWRLFNFNGKRSLTQGFSQIKYRHFILPTSITAFTYGYWRMIDDYPNVELSPEHFVKYRISNRSDVDQDHFLMELTPLKSQEVNWWVKMGYKKLWSVEIKQPDIMVVRSYTPLPMYYSQADESFKFIEDHSNAEGKLSFYIKQYSNGEVAKWLHNLPLGHIVELRGPFIEYEFPDFGDRTVRNRSFLFGDSVDKDYSEDAFEVEPIDINMFTAGTGIVTALQLSTSYSPFRGKINLFHSCKSTKELGPLVIVLQNLSDQGRINLHFLESEKGERINQILNNFKDLIPNPEKFYGPRTFNNSYQSHILKPVLSLVCGPKEYIKLLAGPKIDLSQGPIGGLLGEKGWNSDNVYKLD